jgi:putative ABC transport system ATP-binding protein
MNNFGVEEGEPIFKIRGLVKRRGDSYCLTIPEMDINIGSRVMLLGDSGSGKSTTLDMLALVLKPDEAKIFTWRPNNEAIDLSVAWKKGQADVFGRLRLKDLGYVLQTGGLLPFLNVKDNISLAAELKKISSENFKLRFLEIIEILKIGHLLKKYPGQLSVGERQRCAIARAVIHAPKLILADEPTASLDPATSDRVFNLLLDLCTKSALVVATHDAERAKKHNFSVYKLKCHFFLQPHQSILAELTRE